MSVRVDHSCACARGCASYGRKPPRPFTRFILRGADKAGIGFGRRINPLSVRSAWNCDEFQFADAKDREQLLPPTAIVGFGSDAGAVKDGSWVAKIDPDRALVSFKEVPMTPGKTHPDVREVSCGESGVLTVERAALINDFEVP